MSDRTEVIPPDDQSSADSTPFLKGQILGGKYKVLDVIASGGMGTVYKVSQMFLLKEFALKTLNKRGITDSTLRRFQLEAKAASSLSHPNLVQVHDFGLLDDGQPYLVMDLIEGNALSKLIKDVGQLDVETTISIMTQVCLGLSYAHDEGVIHRDIKPGNIILVENAKLGTEGSVKIVDFGIAKIVSNDDGEIQTLTNTGEIFGSPFYMSPEQCLGGKIDHRSDIYSLGCLLYECLTGSPPHIGQNALRTMMLHESTPAVSLKQATLGKEFPDALERIVAKMLAKSPADRYQNLGLVAHDLSSVSRREPLAFVAEKPREKPQQQRKAITFDPFQFAGILALTAILSGGLAAFVAVRFSSPGTENQSKQAHADASQSSNAATPVDSVGSIENGIRQQEEKIKRMIESAPRIEPKVVVEKDGARKEFIFPDCKIGMVSCDHMFIDAQGKVSLPANSTVGLILNEWTCEKFLLASPEFFRKIDPSAFCSLTLSDDSDSPSPSEVAGMPDVEPKLAEILDIVSRWTALETLRLQDLSLSSKELNVIQKSTKIKSLHLLQGEIVSTAKDDDPICLKTRELELAELAATSTTVREILRNATCLENLEIKDMFIEPGTLAELKNCPNLTRLQLRLKSPQMPEIVKDLDNLRQLRSVRFSNFLSLDDLNVVCDFPWLKSIEVKQNFYDENTRKKLKSKDRRISFI